MKPADEIMALRRENEELRRTLEARKLIERAKGLLMDRDGCSEAEAFRRIQTASMDTRTPMAEIARALILAEQVRPPAARDATRRATAG